MKLVVTYWEMRRKVDIMSPSQDSVHLLTVGVWWGGGGTGNEGHREIRLLQGHHNVQRKGISQKIEPRKREREWWASPKYCFEIVCPQRGNILNICQTPGQQVSNGTPTLIIFVTKLFPRKTSKILPGLCWWLELSWFGISCYHLGTS